MTPGADSWSRRNFLKTTGSGVAASALGFPFLGRPRPPDQSCILLGIDGMDPHLTARLLSEGRMPNTRRLMQSGSLRALTTSDPPQSPVAWSNVISGTNPGGHGIFDFIARDAASLQPYLSTSRLVGSKRVLPIGEWRIPLAAQEMVNLRRGPTFWQDLEREGVPCTLIRMPANFPPSEARGNTLSGLGTPDIHGSYGIFTFYTDKKGVQTHDVSGGRIERVRTRNHSVDCRLRGPVNDFHESHRESFVNLRVNIDPMSDAVRVSLPDSEILLREGEWSNWVPIQFELVPHVVNMPGMCRLFLKSAREPFALYVSPVNIDPVDPCLPISTPGDYAADLAHDIGRFHTQGMPQDTSALSAGVFSDDDYRNHAEHVLEESLRLFEHELNRFKSGFFFHYFSSLDLNSHAFWRAMDPRHPLYTDELARRHGDFLPWLYGKMDDVIGAAAERCDDNTVLMAISDHGFTSFRRQFNLNSWLLDNGYATPAGRERGDESFFADIDWGGTRAYGLGINSLYLNVRGREPDGRVEPGQEARGLADELAMRLKDVRDPDDGQLVVSNVYKPSDIYSGPHTGDAPDLIVCYNDGYRASWDTILGRYPREHVLDNEDPWSGDHTLDSKFMSGVFISNRPLETMRPSLTDIAPTILDLFDMEATQGMTGSALLGRKV